MKEHPNDTPRRQEAISGSNFVRVMVAQASVDFKMSESLLSEAEEEVSNRIAEHYGEKWDKLTVAPSLIFLLKSGLWDLDVTSEYAVDKAREGVKLMLEMSYEIGSFETTEDFIPELVSIAEHFGLVDLSGDNVADFLRQLKGIETVARIGCYLRNRQEADIDDFDFFE